MRVCDLIHKLSALPFDMEVMILDSENGGGHPRAINVGPHKHVINRGNEDWTFDCENKVGQTVAIIGYGCY